MALNPPATRRPARRRFARDHPASPEAAGPERVTGRQLCAGLGWSAALAVLLAIAITGVARAAAPHWARTEGLTVAIVAAVYLAVIAGLAVAVGGPRGVHRLLAVRRPAARQLGLSMAALVVAVAAGIGVSLACSSFSGGVPATLRAIVAAGSDEARLPTATALTWALIVIRLLFLTGTAEELLFRGAIYSWLRRRASSTVTTIAMHITIDLALFLAAVALS